MTTTRGSDPPDTKCEPIDKQLARHGETRRARADLGEGGLIGHLLGVEKRHRVHADMRRHDELDPHQPDASAWQQPELERVLRVSNIEHHRDRGCRDRRRIDRLPCERHRALIDPALVVRGVTNAIVVFQPVVAPHALLAAIQAALERQVQREAKRIQLNIVDGKVTVTGAVRSRAEHDAVIGATWGTRGVEIVIDQLHVDPSISG